MHARSIQSLLLATVAACGRGAATPARSATPNVAQTIAVRATPVREESVAQPVIATGTVAAKEETPLAFKIGGVVAEVFVHEGETVRAGQPLASLDLREIDALVSKAKSNASKAERDLARVRRLDAESVATL